MLTLLTSWWSLALAVAAHDRASRANRIGQEHPATARHLAGEWLFRMAETGPAF